MLGSSAVPPPGAEAPWASPTAEVLTHLNITAAGLATNEAASRIERFGHNELEPSAGPSPVRLVVTQFRNPLIYILLRFGLEVVALISLAIAAWTMNSGPVRWVAVVGIPAIAVISWGVFNVVDDPSRSGQAPVEVSGWIRLAIERVCKSNPMGARRMSATL